MNTRKTIHQVSNTINTDPLDLTNLHFFNLFSLPICLLVIGFSLNFVTTSVKAETTGTVDVHRGYRYIPYEGTTTTTTESASHSIKTESSTSGDKNAQIDQKTEPVSKPTDGKGKLPTFAEADINGDHYLTKDVLQNFPYMLQVFDKVDAGKDGKLEQHEYQNLEMETKREGEIR